MKINASVKDVEELLNTTGITNLGALSPKALDKLYCAISAAIHEAGNTGYDDGYASAVSTIEAIDE